MSRPACVSARIRRRACAKRIHINNSPVGRVSRARRAAGDGRRGGAFVNYARVIAGSVPESPSVGSPRGTKTVHAPPSAAPALVLPL
ncbi:hypothetical protein EVAR_282_1 [Eumeta japonica]|uniref:Uncharacterized protein n=1 Tax=Eumeta variegata TaxID=151549 RepID=A0A4C1SCL6_EUMVA|nr:hypothetical protein EVAR_282_1 [Eumeta japonica]